MKKVLAALLILVISTVVNASLVTIGFESSEGYSSSSFLSSNGWDDASVLWYSTNAMSNSGSRSALAAVKALGSQSCSYDVDWTPSSSETTIVYSAYVALQKISLITGGSFVGIVLNGLTDDSDEVAIGGITLNISGTVKMWDDAGYSTTTSYSYTASKWYQLTIQADFANNTVQFLLNGVVVGSTTLSDDITSLSSIELTNGATGVGGHNARYDTITVDAIPEPATICMLGLGALSFIRNRRK